jgi:hypothetical protein
MHKETSIGLKGASGLGDTIIAYPIIKWYAQRYNTVYYMSDYPELYETLPNVKCYPHQKINYFRLGEGNKHPVDIRFTYTPRKYTEGTSQFVDSCMSAKAPDDLKFKIDWEVKNHKLITDIANWADGRKICILSAPYEPFGREDQWGALLRINPDLVQKIVDTYKDKVYFVQIGNSFVLHRIKGIINLIEKTTVSDLMDLVRWADFGLSQIGNLLPMCEALNTKNFIIFSKAGLETDNRFLSSITPDKTVHYKHLNTSVVDDNIDKAVEEFGKFII